MSVKTKALIAIGTAAVLWASAGAVAKLLFETAPPFVVATHRFFLATLFLLPFFLREHKPKGYFVKLLPLGLFNAGNILFYYSGLYLTTANTAVLLGTAVPITTAVLSGLMIRERISKEKISGIAIGLMGALVIVLMPLYSHGTLQSGSLLGNLLLLGSTLSWTLYIIYSRSSLAGGTYSPVISVFMNVSIVTVATAIAALLHGQQLFSVHFMTPSYLGVQLFASLGITVVTFFLFQWAVQHVTAATASLKEYLQLVVGVGINAVILGEHLTVTYLIGSILIVVGVSIATGGHISGKIKSLLFSQSV